MTGKRVGRHIYAHIDYINEAFEDSSHRAFLMECFRLVQEFCIYRNEYREEAVARITAINVVKYVPGASHASFLEYRDFDEVAHPRLMRGYIVRPEEYIGDVGIESVVKYRKYHGYNILHRKELLVGDSHPDRDRWVTLTKEEEDAGLYENAYRPHIGRHAYWQALLRQHKLYIWNYSLVSHDFMVATGTPFEEEEIKIL